MSRKAPNPPPPCTWETRPKPPPGPPDLFGGEKSLPSYERGVQEERAAWVAWLRHMADDRPVGCGLRLTYGDIADRGEAGERRRKTRAAGAEP